MCQHEIRAGTHECVRCGAIIRPAERQLAHVREARRILRDAADTMTE